MIKLRLIGLSLERQRQTCWLKTLISL